MARAQGARAQMALAFETYEVVSSGGVTRSAALVTADFSGTDERNRLVVTVQLSSLAGNMEAGYRQGFDAGLDNLAGAARRIMVLQRVVQAPRGARTGFPAARRGSICERAANGCST